MTPQRHFAHSVARSDDSWSLTVAVHDFRATVSCNDLEFLRLIDGLFPQAAGLSSDSPGPQTHYAARLASSEQGHHQLLRDRRVIMRTRSLKRLAAGLESDLAVAAARFIGSRHHLVHAGAVSLGGRGVLLPGTSGIGKSTLVAALVLSGFDYLSDEFAVINHKGHLLPFPKAITLRPRGWNALNRDVPGVSAGLHSDWTASVNGVVHLLPPPNYLQDWNTQGVPVEMVILPSYVQAVRPVVSAIPRSDALAVLVDQSMNLCLRGKVGFDVLVGVTKRARCYSIRCRDLHSQVALVKRLLINTDPSGDDTSKVSAFCSRP